MMKIGWALFTSIALAGAAAPLAVAQADEKHQAGREAVSLNDIPKPARDKLQKEAGADTIKKVERESKNGKTLFYADVAKKDGATYLIEVNDKGDLIKKETPKRH